MYSPFMAVFTFPLKHHLYMFVCGFRSSSASGAVCVHIDKKRDTSEHLFYPPRQDKGQPTSTDRLHRNKECFQHVGRLKELQDFISQNIELSKEFFSGLCHTSLVVLYVEFLLQALVCLTTPSVIENTKRRINV
jgi:hypothetical protein